MVLELRALGEVDRARLARRLLGAVVTDDVELARERGADGARVREPLLGVAVDEPVALGARVVLVEHRTPPLDHLVLHLDRTRRRRVDAHLQRRQVVLLAYLRRQLEHADEHRRHDLRGRHLVSLDEREELLGIEVLHHDDGRAETLRRHREAQRRGVVERRGGEVHRRGVDAEEHRHEPGQRRHRAERRTGQRRLHALGPSRRARRVEHVVALDSVGEWLGGIAGDRGFERLVSVDDAVEHQLEADVRDRQLGGLLCLVCGRDEDLCFAVVDDVLELGGREPRARGRVVEAGVVRAPRDREEQRVVLHAERDVVTGA